MRLGFDALFAPADGGPRIAVGPFDTLSQADTWGTDRHTADHHYVGAVRRMSPDQFDRHTIGKRLARNYQGTRGRTGMVTRWDEGCGFATDSEGASWFLSDSDLPDSRVALPVGTIIAFTGSPHPSPGTKYPRARSITIVETPNTHP